MSIIKFWSAIFSLAFLRLHFGGESSSSSANTTKNEDRRNAVQDGIGVSGDSNVTSITNNVTDAGIVSRALDSIDLNNATSAQGLTKLLDTSGDLFDGLSSAQASGFNKLLDVAGNLWNEGQNLIGTTQKAVADAYGQAQSDKAGSIDNRTLIVLAVAGAAALAFIKRKG